MPRLTCAAPTTWQRLPPPAARTRRRRSLTSATMPRRAPTWPSPSSVRPARLPTASGCLRQANEQGKSSPLPQTIAGAFWLLDMDVGLRPVPAAAFCSLTRACRLPPTSERRSTRPSAGGEIRGLGYEPRHHHPYRRRRRELLQSPGVAITVPAGNSGYDSLTASNEHVYRPSRLRDHRGRDTLQRASNARGWTEMCGARLWPSRTRAPPRLLRRLRLASWELGADCSG